MERRDAAADSADAMMSPEERQRRLPPEARELRSTGHAAPPDRDGAGGRIRSPARRGHGRFLEQPLQRLPGQEPRPGLSPILYRADHPPPALRPLRGSPPRHRRESRDDGVPRQRREHHARRAARPARPSQRRRSHRAWRPARTPRHRRAARTSRVRWAARCGRPSRRWRAARTADPGRIP